MEKKKLQAEQNNLSAEIAQTELKLGQMRANLNALNGAIQQTDKYLQKYEG